MRRAVRCMFLMLLSFGVVSCTVKEDRTQCPCILEVEFLQGESIKYPVILTGWNDKGRVFTDDVTTLDSSGIYRCRVPRGMLLFGAFHGLVENRYVGHSVEIPPGFQCDSLYACNDYVDCTGETARTTVDFHKQFTTVNLLISTDGFVAEDYSFVVESGTGGIDILTCTGVAGHFTFQPQAEEDDSLHFRLPRQCDDSLMLKVTHNSDGSVKYPLGRYIQSIGYDWNAEELTDIYITIDIVRGQVSVGVAQWEVADEFELSQIEM